MDLENTYRCFIKQETRSQRVYFSDVQEKNSRYFLSHHSERPRTCVCAYVYVHVHV